jgi:GDPmannose 4,6-dehydratase
MLQQEQPDDFVIATGLQYSVREFVQWSAAELGITLGFSKDGVDEVGIVEAVADQSSTAVKPGDVIVRVDPRYFRPAEVETLLGDPTKARQLLGWEPETTAQEMCAEMVAADLAVAKQHALLGAHGYPIKLSTEN